ncbi:MAG: NUDIX domain-containing protein [Gammaproteobacteria bacterium]|nr:NUDIX domain-containing protein [Gammaproteobacteria bacterium]
MQPFVIDNIRLAATVLLMRDGVQGPEVFMVQRPRTGDFPDLHVFPGGKVDEQDFIPEHATGLDDDEASRMIGVDAGGLRSWVAAIRECFEECGVLLATRNGEPVQLKDAAESQRFEENRHALISGELSMDSFCKAEDLELACDRLTYFSHWITPETAPRRFDTRFFITRMPDGQATLAHVWETADDVWVVPNDALAEYRAGRWQMISPTLTTLASIAEYQTVTEMLADVAREGHLDELTDEMRTQGMHPLR